MKFSLPVCKVLLLLLGVGTSLFSSGQLLEWRLANRTFNSADPDGAGPATGVATFTLQIRSTGANVTQVNAISTGYSYQSALATIPSTTACNAFSNITLSSAFTAAGFTITAFNQCSDLTAGGSTFLTGGQTFNRRAVGTIEAASSSITITNEWLDIYTVTLWTLGTSSPQGGYVAINSGAGGSPGQFTTYAVADVGAIEYAVNSLTFATPLPLGAGTLPVRFTRFSADCLPNRSINVSWSTSEETNNSYFDIEKSTNGVDWKSVGRVNAGGNSATSRNYQFNDPQGGTAEYRLKQVDIDGKVTYSNIARTSCDSRNVYVSLFPVPARDFVNLVIGADRTIKTSIQVFDNNGKLVVNMPVTLNNGQNNFRIDVQHLTAGEYYIKGSNAGIEINKRFTIVR